MTLAVPAATRIASINRRASQKQRNRLCRATIVPELAELGIRVVSVSIAVELACDITAHVVTIRHHGVPAVRGNIERENAVLKIFRIQTVNAATTEASTVPVEGRVADL